MPSFVFCLVIMSLEIVSPIACFIEDKFLRCMPAQGQYGKLANFNQANNVSRSN